jgi:phosphoribosylanthranilate isomerase
MRPRVKVCCIASVAEARMAIDAGASALGLVSAMPSGPGPIDESLIAEIAASVPARIATFLLTALQEADAIILQHRRCGTSVLQLVDAVEPPVLRHLREALPAVELVQVIHVTGGESLAQARAAAPWVDALLLDSGNPSLAVKQLGGTGRTHDWTLSQSIRNTVSVPVWLAGGLGAHNVAAAIDAVKPQGVDLCSSLRTDGRLDKTKLDAFFGALPRA